MQAFKEGDVVRVKVGGPSMSVVCVVENYAFGDERDTAVLCIFENEHMLFEQAYPPRALDKVNN